MNEQTAQLWADNWQLLQQVVVNPMAWVRLAIVCVVVYALVRRSRKDA